MALEATYRTKLIKKIKRRIPGSVVLPNDPAVNQGICDILILSGHRWGMLEIKRAPKSKRQPNQPYYVKKFNDMSFAAFIDPTNEESVLNALQSALGVSG